MWEGDVGDDERAAVGRGLDPQLAIEGGKQLSVKFKMKGKAFRLATMLDQFKLR